MALDAESQHGSRLEGSSCFLSCLSLPVDAGGDCGGGGHVYRYEPSFEDNVKQDISIDVYGRKEDEKGDLNSEIERLANI